MTPLKRQPSVGRLPGPSLTVHRATRERIAGLPSLHPATNPARRLLSAAIGSSNALALYAQVPLMDSSSPQLGLFSLEEAHQPSAEIARSLYVFAGASIDVTLKQLVRDALNPVLQVNRNARVARDKFLENVGQQNLLRFAKTEDPAAARDQHYISQLTRASLQQSGKVNELVRALGLNDPSERTVSTTLDPVLKARNQIVHDLDVDSTTGNRRPRSSRTAIADADGVFNLLIDILEATSSSITGP